MYPDRESQCFLVSTTVVFSVTTFSTFSLDTALLWERDAYAVAIVYVIVSIVFGVLGLFGGLALVRSLS